MPKPKLERFDVIEIKRRSDDNVLSEPMTGSFYEADDKSLKLRVRECPFRRGDVLQLKVKIRDDARYVLSASMRSFNEGTLILEPLGEWARIQEREYFRIRTGRVPAEMTRQASNRTDDDKRAKSFLYDISGGGAMVETQLKLEIGETVTIRFELPGSTQMTIKCTVLRVSDLTHRRRRAGLRFNSATADERAEILRWVFSKQMDSRARERDLDY